jgi:hypothetical protein
MGIHEWKSHLEDMGTDGRILIQILKKYDGRADGINPAQKRENWWAPLNIVMNLHIP